MAIKKENSKTKGKRPIAARDAKFVDLVAKGESSSKAYVKAGFKNTKNVRQNASQKLAKPDIQSALQERKEYFRSIADVEAKDIIGAQQEIAFASIEDALDDNGYLDFAKAKQNGAVKLIKRITRHQTQYGENVTVEFYSRSDALSQLADIVGLKKQPQMNPIDAELAKLKGRIDSRAREKGISYEDEVRNYLDHYAEDVRPEIKDRLASELIQ